MNNEPSPPVSNGERLRDGTFGKGNTFGRGGNPYLRRIHQLRSKLLDCTTEEDIEQLIATLRRLSLGGDVAAVRTWLEYALGKPRAVALSGPDGEPLGSGPIPWDLTRLTDDELTTLYTLLEKVTLGPDGAGPG
jgi:hypothetical protein